MGGNQNLTPATVRTPPASRIYKQYEASKAAAAAAKKVANKMGQNGDG